jgi:hypothetical protein
MNIPLMSVVRDLVAHPVVQSVTVRIAEVIAISFFMVFSFVF